MLATVVTFTGKLGDLSVTSNTTLCAHFDVMKSKEHKTVQTYLAQSATVKTIPLPHSTPGLGVPKFIDLSREEMLDPPLRPILRCCTDSLSSFSKCA